MIPAQYTRTLRWLLLACLAASALLLVANLMATRTHATTFCDEYFYLNSAKLFHDSFAFHDPAFPEERTPYAPLFPILLSPFARGQYSDLYPTALALNFALLLLTASLTTLLAKRRANLATTPSILLGILTFLSLGGYALSAMSEPLFFALFFACVYLLLKPTQTLRSALLSCLLIAAIILARKYGIILIAAIPLYLLLQKPSRKNLLVSIAIALCGILAYRFIIYNLHLVGGQSLSRYSNQLLQPQTLLLILRPTLGQIGYLHVASFGLLPIALFYVFRQATQRHWKPLLILLFLALSILPGIGLMLFYLLEHSIDPRYLMYGRYVDHATPAILILGLLGIHDLTHLSTKHRLLTLAACLLFAALISLAIPQHFSGTHVINMSVAYLHTFSHNLHLSIHATTSLLSAALYLLLLFLLKTRARPLLYIPPYILAIISLIAVAKAQHYCEKIYTQQHIIPPSITTPIKLQGRIGHFPSPYTRARYFFGDRVIPPNSPEKAVLFDLETLSFSDPFNGPDLLQTLDLTPHQKPAQNNPWGATPSHIKLPSIGPAIISTSGALRLTTPTQTTTTATNLTLTVTTGFYPPAATWNVSDGATVRLTLSTNNIPAAHIRHRFLPTDPPRPLTLTASLPANTPYTLTLETLEDQSQSLAGDWIFFSNLHTTTLP